jgi:hypothetical protein
MMLISKKYNQILYTLAYADIFHFPLTFKELNKYHIGKRYTPQMIRSGLKKFTSENDLDNTHRLFYLSGSERIPAVRRKRYESSLIKWQIVHDITLFLSFIPTISLIGVTGGLAMNNADENDDIDLFFVVSSGTLWITRLCTVLVTGLVGCRRKPGDKIVRNSVCLNMFMTEDALSLPDDDRDLYSAHEVIQMRPVLNRGNIYSKFLRENSWVIKYLPNAWEKLNKEYRIENRENTKSKQIFFSLFTILYSLFIIQLLEPFARMVQLWYMKRRWTTEVVSKTLIKFHPRNQRVWIYQEFQKRLKRLNIPLDKEFFKSIK